MATTTHAPMTGGPALLDYFLALDISEGFRAQFIGGEIVVSPVPDGDHEDCLSTLDQQVRCQSTTDMAGSGTRG